MKGDLYICMTYYHVLVTLVKALVSGLPTSVMVANTMPEYEALMKRLEMSGCFEGVVEYKAEEIDRGGRTKKDLVYFLTDKRRILRRVPRFVDVDFWAYAHTYLYNDSIALGKYFVLAHIPYHLVEDALDYFKYFDRYWRIESGSYQRGTLKFFLKERLGIGYLAWGQSPDCIDIEVNDLEGIRIPVDKCIEVPRRELFGALTDSDAEVIRGVFMPDGVSVPQRGRVALVLTQPLHRDGFVGSEGDQLAIFSCLVESLLSEGYAVALKPHPRDLADYDGIAATGGVTLLDKDMPSEVLNLAGGVRFDLAVSVTSTSVNFLENVGERRILGARFIDEVLGRGDV